MKKIIYCLLAILLLNVGYAKIPMASLSLGESSMAPALKNAMPAVVNISMQGEIPEPESPFLKHEIDQIAKSKNLSPRIRQFSGVGSGVIVDADKGLIVTNAHVVDMSKTIIVTLSDGRRFSAMKVGADNKSDLAVLRIQASHLTALPFGDSSQLKVGDIVAAIGSPFGLNQTVTSGIISSLNRSGLGLESLENFIQTDAPINPGNSGGALIDMQGRLIGVNTAIFSTNENGGNVGVGFAIPSNMVKSVVEQLLKFGKVHRGVMGIVVQTVTPDIAKALGADTANGAVVTGVMPYSAAEKAKLMVGDIIVKINDQAVQSYADVVDTLGLYPMGQPTWLTVIRDGKLQKINATTADVRVAQKKQLEANPFLYGLVLQNISIDTPDRGYVEGVQILDVKDFSPASAVGLSPGDIILSANQTPTKTVGDLKREAQKSKGSLLLFVLHQRQSLFVVLQ